MQVVLKPVVNQTKNGYLARSPELRLAAYGSTLDLATKNLERLTLLYLRPFERAGSLVDEVSAAGLRVEKSDQGLSVRLGE